MIKILWICGLPRRVQNEVLAGKDYGAYAEWSWILGHLPPPADVELHIACRTGRHTERRDFFYRGAHFHLVPVKSRLRPFVLFRLDAGYFRRLFAELKPDVVHGWGTEDAYGSVAIQLAPDRNLVEVQGNLHTYRRRAKLSWLTRITAINERLVLARARHVAAENEYSLQAAMPMIRTRSVFAIEHPIRQDFHEAEISSGQARQVLFLGNLDERKGIWDALEAFGRGTPRDWKLAIVGGGDPRAVARLRARISGQDLQGRVHHHPQLDAAGIIEVMQSSSVFLLPTRIDTGPTALKESMALGLWPVCYDNSGPGHYIRKFGYGNLAQDLNLADLTEALKGAIEAQNWKTPANRGKINASIRPHFDRVRIWQDLMALYREISGSSGR